MSGSQVPGDFVVQFGRVAGSSLAAEADTGRKVAVLYSVEGAGELGAAGEHDSEAEVFGALGVVGRPLPPGASGGQSSHAEVVCLRTADGLVPIAARDVRLRMQGNGPGSGTIALVGYGGGFHSLSPVDGADLNKGTVIVAYCPYDYSPGGVAQKAHAIILDPTSGNESISIVHAEGQSLLLMADGSMRMQSPDGQSYVQLKDGKVEISAAQIVLNGTVSVGNPTVAAAFPLLPGPASPPCPRLFLSPTV